MRAVIYCRVSTKEQVQNFSLATQERECRRWCDANGYAVDRVFVDAGESAKTADRPEFQQLIAHCRQNKKTLNAVVVHSLSRFSRNTLDHHTVRALLSGFGITLRSVSEPTDDSPEGLLVEDFMASLANYENRAKARRTLVGMRAAMEAGRWAFVAPIGLLNSADRGGPSLIPDPERAHLVQSAFREFGSGHLTRPEVLRRITGLDLRTRKGLNLSAQSFHAVLRNPLYAGRIVVPSLGVNTVGDFPPLIAPDLFGRVQRLLAGKEKAVIPHTRNHPDFPLRRFVRCESCRTPLTASWSKGRTNRYPYYHCRSCKVVKVRKERLEASFVSLLDRLQPHAGYMRLFRAVVIDVWKARQADAVEARKAVQARCEALRSRLDEVEHAFIHERRIDRDSYERRRDSLRSDIAFAEMEFGDAKIEELDVEGVLAYAEGVLTNASQLWLNATLDQKQRLQSVVFPEGLSFDGDEFGTAVTCLAFRSLGEDRQPESSVASPTGSPRPYRVISGPCAA